MKIVEAVRRLRKGGFTPWEDSCHLTCELCGADFAEDGADHETGCPWMAMPQIVSVIETIDYWLKRRNEILDGKNVEEGDSVRVVDSVAAYVLEKFYFSD